MMLTKLFMEMKKYKPKWYTDNHYTERAYTFLTPNGKVERRKILEKRSKYEPPLPQGTKECERRRKQLARKNNGRSTLDK